MFGQSAVGNNGLADIEQLKERLPQIRIVLRIIRIS